MLVAAACAAPAADASSRQLLIMQDDVSAPQLRQPRRLDEFDALGADVVKVNLYWDGVAPARAQEAGRLRRLQSRGYTWGSYVAVDQAITQPRHAAVPQPRRTAPRLGHQAARPAPARSRPAPRSSGSFAQAAGSQFPSVDIWSIWNEPNLNSWLSPAARQARARCRRRSIAASIWPAIAAWSAGGHGGDTILLGELMPRGGTSTAQGAPARVPARDGVPGPQLPPVSAAARREEARLPQGRPLPDLRHRLPPLHTARRARTCTRAPTTPPSASFRACARTLDALARRGKLPRRLADLDHRVRLPDQAARPHLRHAAEARRLRSWTERVDRVPQPARGQLLAVHAADDRPPGRAAAGLLAGRPALPRRQTPSRACTTAFRLPCVRSHARRQPRRGVRRAPRRSGGTAQVESKPPGGSYRSLGSAAVNSTGYFRQRLPRQRGVAAQVQGHARRHHRASRSR